MIAAVALALAGCCAVGGAYLTGHMQGALDLKDRRKVDIPLLAERGTTATVVVPFAMTADEWDVFLVTLHAMMPGLVLPGGATQARMLTLAEEEPDPLRAIREHEAEVEEAVSHEMPYDGAHPFRRPRKQRAL